MINVLKLTELKVSTGKVLDDAIERPQYVQRNGVLLVITVAQTVTGDDPLVSPWEQRANTLASFYDTAKAW